MAAAFSWREVPDLMARLRATQNASCNVSQDIMTFAGFCQSREALERHVAFYEARELEALYAKRSPRAVA